MVRVLFKLALFFLVAHALFRFVPPYWNHTQFEHELEERILTWHTETEIEIRDQVLEMAQRHQLPLAGEQVAIRREREHLFVDVLYRRRIALIPGWKHEWIFESNVDAWMVRPRVPLP